MKKVNSLRVLVDRYIDDSITGHLFAEWCSRHREGRICNLVLHHLLLVVVILCACYTLGLLHIIPGGII
jgi:hypothetical protein